MTDSDGRVKVEAEGYKFKIPWLQRPIIYDCRDRTENFGNQQTGTKDLQTVSLDVRVIFRPDVRKLGQLYRDTGPSHTEGGLLAFDKMVMPSIVVEVLKSTVAAFDADKLVTERSAVSKMMFERLNERCQVYGITLKDVAITDFRFSPMYEQAVERKQISQQTAQRAQIMVRKAYQEKQQKIVEAQGEEQSARLVGAMIAENPAYLNLEKIKAAKEIATVIAQSTNRVYLNSESLLLDVNNAQIDAAQLKGKGGSKSSSSWF